MQVFFPSEPPPAFQFVVIAARHQGKWVYVRHQERDSYELPGGRIEPGESPYAAAERELYEESGALDFHLKELCTYGVRREGVETYGILYITEVSRFAPLPEFEMAERRLFETEPESLTYPLILPRLMERVREHLFQNKGEILHV